MKVYPQPELKPKRVNPMRATWLQLKSLGYDVIPLNLGKDKPFTGWPKMPNHEADIARWNGHAAAVRFYRSNLFMIDIDIRVAAVRDQILAWLTLQHPEFMASCLRRHSEGVTLALIGRCATVKRQKATARYLGAGTDPKGDFVELFTGADKRYAGVWGVHRQYFDRHRRLEETRRYGYTGRSILEVPADQLPWFPDAGIGPLTDACEAIMRAAGWERIAPPRAEGDAVDVYDLEPTMRFRLEDGSSMTLEDLESHADGYAHYSIMRGGNGRLRGYATLWDPSSSTRDRVSVLVGSTGLILHDFKEGVNHRWKDRAPPPDTLGEKLRELIKNANFAWGTAS